MSDTLVDIANAVAALIDGATLSQAVTTQREWVPDRKITQLGNILVPVVPSAENERVATRGSVQIEYKIDIGIMRRVTADVGTPVDEMRLLVREIKALFRFHKLPDQGVSLLEIENEPIYDADHLRKLTFISVIKLTYQGFE